DPSQTAATWSAASPSGIGTQPFHVIAGFVPAPDASTSNTSIASREPWPTAYNVEWPLPPGRMCTPWVTHVAVDGGVVQSANCASCFTRERSSGYSFACDPLRESINEIPASAAKPLTMSHGVLGTRTRSSPFLMPQTNSSPPLASHRASAALTTSNESDAPSSATINGSRIDLP